MNSIHFRIARSGDAAQLLEMIRELAAQQGDEAKVRTDAAILQAHGFGDHPRFGALLAEFDGVLAGFITYTWRYAIWCGSMTMDIDDAFVRPEHRGRGIGRMMLRQARAVAVGQRAARLRWEARREDPASMRFCKRLGASMRDQGVFVWPAADDLAACER